MSMLPHFGLTIAGLLPGATTTANQDVARVDAVTGRFARGTWSPADWLFVKRRDMYGRSAWVQQADCIENDGHHTSMVYHRSVAGDLTVSCTMAFTERMAPSIVFAPRLGATLSGEWAYDDVVEVVLWDQGVNVWDMRTVAGKSVWTRTAFWPFPLESNTPYRLEVARRGPELTIRVADRCFGCPLETLRDGCHVGITGAEGVNRFYDFTLWTAQSTGT